MLGRLFCFIIWNFFFSPIFCRPCFAMNIWNLLIITKWDRTIREKKPCYLYSRKAKVGFDVMKFIRIHAAWHAKWKIVQNGGGVRTDWGSKTEFLIVFLKFISWIRNYLFEVLSLLWRFSFVFISFLIVADSFRFFYYFCSF